MLTRDRSFYRSLVRLAWPIALQNLVTFSVGLSDQVMIGTLGDAAVSGVYMAGQVQTLVQVWSAGIEGVILVLAAQYGGRRDTERMRRVAAVGCMLTAAVSLLLSLVCGVLPRAVIGAFTHDAAVAEVGAAYLRLLSVSFPMMALTQALTASMRSVERPCLGLWVSLASLGVKLTLNYGWIFGGLGLPRLGATGAALATVVARAVELGAIALLVLVWDRRLSLRPRSLVSVDRAMLREVVRHGTPILLGQLVWGANLLLGAAIVGTYPKEVVGAVGVASVMNNLGYVVINGLAHAVGILTGKAVGAGDFARAKEYARTVQVLFLALGLLTGTAVLLGRGPFVALFGISPAARTYAHGLLAVLALTLVGTCYQSGCLYGLVKSGGDVGFVFRTDALLTFLWTLPSAYVAMRLGAVPWVVLLCLKSDQLLKCAVAAVKVNARPWMRRLTGDAAPN